MHAKILLINLIHLQAVVTKLNPPENEALADLETCIERIIINNTNKTDTVLIINKSCKYRDLKISPPSLTIQCGLEPLKSFQLHFVDFYVIITSSGDFERIATHLSRTESWNPRGKFLVIFDNEEPSYDFLGVLEKYYVWRIITCDPIKSMFYSYGAKPETVGSCVGEMDVAFPSTPPTSWTDLVWSVGYVSAPHSPTDSNNTNFLNMHILNLILRQMGVKCKYVDITNGTKLTKIDFRCGGVHQIQPGQTDITQPLRFEKVHLVVSLKKGRTFWGASTKLISVLSLFCIIGGSATLYIFGLHARASDMGSYRSFGYCLLTVYKISLLHCIKRLPKQFAIRSLVILLWCSSLTIFGVVQGKWLTMIFYKGMNPVVSDVESIAHSDLKIGHIRSKYQDIMLRFFGEEEYERLNYERCDTDALCLQKVATEDDFVTACMDSVLNNITESLLDEEGRPQFHVLQGRYYSFQFFVIFSKRLPMFHKINALILDIHAHGFSDLHYKSTMQFDDNLVKTQNNVKVLRLQDMRFCFCLLLGGLFGSFICFLGEVLWKNNREGEILQRSRKHLAFKQFFNK